MRIRHPGWGKEAAGKSDGKPQMSRRYDPERQGLRKVRLRLAGLPTLLFLSLAFWAPPPLAPEVMAAAGNATGKPAVSSDSIAGRGYRATATLGDVADHDGIDAATLSYTWLRCNANGSGCNTEIATGASYTLTEDDVGLRLRLRVDFLDEDGASESLTSFPWPSRANDPISMPPAPAALQVLGHRLDLTFDQDLKSGPVPPASAFTVEVDDQAMPVVGIDRSGDRTLRLTLARRVAPDATVTVGYTRPSGGDAQEIRGPGGVPAESFAALGVSNATPENQVAAGAPEIEVVSIADNEIVLRLHAPADNGGLAVTGYQYRYARGASVPEAVVWTAAGGTAVTISGLRNSTEYTIEARAATGQGTGPAARRAATTTSLSRNATGRPAVSSESLAGTGHRATATLGDVADADGIDAATLSYIWLRCDADGDNCDTEIATGPSYILTEDDVGLRLRLRVDYLDDAGTFESRTSFAWPSRTNYPIRNFPTSPPGAPGIEAVTIADHEIVLRLRAPARSGGLTVTGYQYRYARGTSVPETVAWTPAGGTTVRVSGLRNSTEYTIEVRAANARGTGPATSRTATTTSLSRDATGRPAVSSESTAGKGHRATATLGDVADTDGIDATTLSYTWLRCDANGSGCNTEIATGASYILTEDDVGLRLRLRVDFLDDTGTFESRTGFPWPSRANDPISMPPAPAALQVLGYRLDLTFDHDLQSGSIPPASAFTVEVDGQAMPVVGIDRSGDRTLRLTLARRVAPDATVTVGYTRPSGGDAQEIRGPGGVPAESFAALGVSNATPENQVAAGAPEIEVVSIADNEIVLRLHAPADNGGLAVTGYQYRYARGASVPEAVVWTAAGGTAVTISGLRNSTEYTIEARAATGQGTGPAARRAATTTSLSRNATGRPAVSSESLAGTGHRATATLGDVADADGIDAATLSYIWLRCDADGDNCDTEIATGPSYILTEDDVGLRLRLRVDYLDDAGTFESRTGFVWPSRTDNPIRTPPAPATLQVLGYRLDLAFDQDLKTGSVPPAGAFTVEADGQAVAVGDVGMAAARTVRLTLARRVTPDETVTIGYARPSGGGVREIQDSGGVPAESFTGRSVSNVTPVNQAATGAPDISGTAELGETLTAGPGTVADANGLSGARMSYQWVRVDGNGETDIAGATGGNYSVSADDAGKRLKVRASFEDDALYPEARTSAATAVVPDTVGPRLLGGGATVADAVLELQFDEPLDTGSRPATAAFAVSVAGSTASVSAVAVSGDTVTLTLASAVGRGESVTLGYTPPAANPIRDALGNEAAGLVSVTVSNLTLSVPGAPTIETATLADNEIVLRLGAPADDGGADISGYQYRYARGASVPEEAAWTDAATTAVTVSGLRNSTTYFVEVRAVNRLGAGPETGRSMTTTSLSRNATGSPAVSGDSIAGTGHRAAATLGDVADADGIDAATLSYTWLRCNANGDNCDIEIATGASYTLTDDDVGLRLRLRVDYLDETGTFESLTSNPWPSRSNNPVRTPPVPATLQVLGYRLDATFDHDLKTGSAPPASAFTVEADGQAIPVVRIQLASARTFRLTLARRVTPDGTVTVAYTRPSGGGVREIQDSGGVPAESFAGRNVENVTPENQAATGAPAISGTAEVGETLTAGPGTIADANGLSGSRMSYRWIRVDEDGETDIAGATGGSYSVSETDIGKRLKVRASFEDDALYPEARTSAATAVVPDTVGPRLLGDGATVSGTVLKLQFDEPLDTASRPAAAAFAVSVAGSTASVSAVAVSGDMVTLTLASAVGRGESVTIGYTAPAANPIQDVSGNDAGGLSAVSVANLTLSVPGAPTDLDSRAHGDNSLMFDWRPPADDGGAVVTAYRYRFGQGATAPGDADWTETGGLSASFNNLRSGTAYSLEVWALNRLGAGPAVTRTGTTSGATDHPATGAPTIAGTVAVRQTLTASTADIADGNGVANASYSYQWVRLDEGAPEDIQDARTSTYRVGLDDVGKQLAVRVDFTDDGGFAETLTSTATVAVPDAENAPPTSQDATIEVAEDGEILIPVSAFHFADEDAGHALARIRIQTLPGAGVLEYLGPSESSTPVAATAGSEIEVDRFGQFGQDLRYRPAANGYGDAYASFTFRVHDGTAWSADSYTMTIDVEGAPDDPSGVPEIDGTAKLGQTLTADLANISDPDGLDNATYTYRWFRIARNPNTRTVIAGAEAGSYAPVAADVGAQVAVEVTFTDDGGGEHTLVSAAYPADGSIAGNDLPTSANSRVETDEDTGYRFAASDFPFADSDGGSLASVKIATLPASGRLALDGADVSAGQAVAVSDLDGGKLVYTPAGNANGSGLASFEFRVNDGSSDSRTNYTMRIDVAAVNDAPDGADSTLTLAEDTAHVFRVADFGFVDVDGDSLASVTLVTVPARGSLTLSGANEGDPPVAAVADQTIARARLDAGELRFTPAANENGSGYAAFAFKVSDGTADSAASRTLTVNVTAVDDPPVAANGAVTADEDVEYAFTLADFNFTDADGDSLDSVLIETLPARGALRNGEAVLAGARISAGDIAGGRLTYLPEKDTGGDGYASFSFKVAANGSESAAYTMTINVTGIDDPTVGGVHIDGKAVVGRTLAANTRFIRDPDGLTSPGYSYRWLRVAGDGTETRVGAAASYTVAAGDLDRRLALSVTLTDDGGTTIRLAAVTDPVVNNSAPEVYSGYIALDEDTSHVFTEHDFSFWDFDSDPMTEVTIVTLPAEGKGVLTLDGADPDDPATAVTAGQAIPAADIEAHRLKYTPPANANSGYDEYARLTYRVSDGLAESNAGEMSIAVRPVNDPTTGAPAIVGALTVGETLTADTSQIQDADGLTNPDFQFDWHWVKEDGSIVNHIGSGSTYTVALEDTGQKLQVLVRFVDDAYEYGELWSEPSDAVQRSAASNNAPTSQDRIIRTDEDLSYIFSQEDFAFSDQDWIDSLESVTIAVLPGKGVLSLASEDSGANAAPVAAGDVVPAHRGSRFRTCSGCRQGSAWTWVPSGEPKVWASPATSGSGWTPTAHQTR